MQRNEQVLPYPLPYALLKFGEEQHIEGFRNDGLLYMQSLAKFAKLESDTARGDSFEGATSLIQPKDLNEFTFDTCVMGLGKFTAKQSDLAGPVRIRKNETALCNVYCMFAVTKPVDGELVSSQNLMFGNSCVIVLNTGEFLSRVIRAAKEHGVRRVEWGLVEYYNADEHSGEIGRFRKRSMFAYQNEFRIVVEPGSELPRELRVGSLLDITSEVLPLCEINQRFDFSTRSAREAGIYPAHFLTPQSPSAR
jgi:hypothetical protein